MSLSQRFAMLHCRGSAGQRALASLLIALVLGLSAFAVSGEAASAAEIFVLTDGDDTCNGSAAVPNGGNHPNCAVKTVQKGADLAANGDTVTLGAGTWYGTDAKVSTNKSITIQGAGRSATILNGLLNSGSTDKLDSRGIEFKSGVTGAAVKNLTVKNFNFHGIIVDGFASPGVGTSGFTVDNVESSDNGDATAATDGAGVVAQRASARGIVVWNGAKSNISITNSIADRNALVGIDIQDGTVSGLTITGNSVTGNRDAGIGVVGPTGTVQIANNTVTNNGRFGIEVKNPDGLTSGEPTIVVENNTVVGNNGSGSDLRDYAGIVVMRRDPVVGVNVDQPAGVLVRNNDVSGYLRPDGSPSDGFGIVVEGTNIQVRNNTVDNNDVGIQAQAGNPPASRCGGPIPGAPTPSGCNTSPYFDRGNASSFSGVIEHNSISNATTSGLRAVGVSGVNAENNWWGSSSGPQHASNPGATGVVVSNGVDFTPFLGHGTDEEPATLGFQPDLDTYTTRFVRLDGSDTECDGTANAAFSADALGFCAVATGQKAANLASNGHTVQFAAGTWQGAAGQINIGTNKALTIQGAGRDQTIIDGQNGPDKTTGRGIGFNAPGTDGATVRNLTVKNFEQHGIYGQGPISNFTVDSVESSDNGANTTNGRNARGVAIWGSTKNGITITNSIFNRNGLERNPGIGVMDGSATNVTITGNHVEGNSDDGIFAIGLGGPGANLIANNTVLNNGRFGIDIALPNGSGAESGPGSIVVEGNTVSRTVPATLTTDHAGIVVMRRSSYITTENLDFSHGVVIRNNVVSGFRANAPGSTGEGFCIVVEGTGMSVHNNAVSDCDVGIQMQKGNTLDQPNTPGFDRGDALDYSGTVEQNSIATSNTVGMRGVGLTEVADATHNWWGNVSGPTNAANAGGTGASVVGNAIDFSPWLGDGTDTSAAIGFQPNLTPIIALATDGINVAPTSGLVTAENGGTAQFAVVLASQPTANVTVPLASSNPNEGTVSPTSLTFTPQNWNVPQTVTVTGVALAPNNGNVPYQIITGLATSADANFNGLVVADVAVTNNASAIPAINVAPTSGLVTTENGGTAQFGVVLGAVPAANVTVPLASSNPNEGTVSPTSLTFTPQNWNTPQTVTVTGVALAPNNGNVPYQIITGPASSPDPAYNGLNPDDVSVTNNAAAVPSVSIADATVAESPSGSATMSFTVTLSQASPSTVTVSYATQDQSATSGANGDYVAAIGTVSFAPGETTKPINVTVVTDTNAEPAETFLVTLSSPSGATISRGQATGTIQDTPLASLSCSPRPDFAVQTQAIGGRQMLVTISAGTSGANTGNVLRTIQFKTPTNATVQLAGQASVGTGTITLPADTRRISFTVTQTDPGAAFLVPYTITDNCGPIEKFAGGGKDAVAN